MGRKKLSDKCIVCGNKYFAKGFCERHWLQQYRYGKIQLRTSRDKNEIVDCGNYYEICLYKKNKEIARAKIDKEELHKIEYYKWTLNTFGYVFSVKNRIQLHQLILGKKNKYEIDHINHDILDNRKINLRYCSHQQNCFNKKNVKGYHWFKRDGIWVASISVNYKTIYLGRFKNKIDAIKCRKKAEIKYFGKFAYN